jgi:hypothetical protein
MMHNPKLSTGVSKLLVGLNFNNREGGVVIWDPLRAQPRKFISFPSPVREIFLLIIKKKRPAIVPLNAPFVLRPTPWVRCTLQNFNLFNLLQVISIAVVSHYEDGGFNTHFFNQAMMTMVGIIAVGMVGGEVCLIDLGLDQLKQQVPPVGWYYKNVFEGTRFIPAVIGPHETNVAHKRHHFVKEKKLIALLVYSKFKKRLFYIDIPL